MPIIYHHEDGSKTVEPFSPNHLAALHTDDRKWCAVCGQRFEGEHECSTDRLTDERFYADMRCDDCGAELSQCGFMGEDGEQELDCRVCQLVNEVGELLELREEIERLAAEHAGDHQTIAELREKNKRDNVQYMDDVAKKHRVIDELREENERLQSDLRVIHSNSGGSDKDNLPQARFRLKNIHEVSR